MLALDIDRTIPSVEDEIRAIQDEVMEEVEKQVQILVPDETPNAEGIRDRICHRTRLIIEETIVDHLDHGNKDRTGEKSKHIRVITKITADGIFYWLSSDEGKGFDPKSIVGPDSPNYKRDDVHGKGIVISRILAEMQGGYYRHPNGESECPIGSCVETEFPLYDSEKYQHDPE